MKKSKLLLVLLILPLFAMAQVREISGTVVDESNNPLPGVNVIVKGFTAGISTDFDGNFSLSCPDGSKTLVVSSTGYVTQEVTLLNINIFKIQLVEDKNILDEVVVVGYGTMRRSDMSGATSTVKVDEQVAQQYATVDQLLVGRAAGVQVVQNGTPGAGISVRIRGASSLTGNNEPLYVVDGVIISSAGEGVANAGGEEQQAQNGLNGINPRDIESMEILKDASATAIYGSRASNGVVLITTKKGEKGKVKINAYFNSSFGEMEKPHDVLSGTEYAAFKNEFDGDTPTYLVQDNEVYRLSYDDDDIGTPGDTPLQQVNWQEDAFRIGVSNGVGVSFSGGSDKGNYYLSAGFNDIEGVVDNSEIKKGDIRLNLNQDLTDKLSMSVKMNAFFSKGKFNEDGSKSSENNSFIGSVIRTKPLIEDDNDETDDFDEPVSTPYSWVNDFDDVAAENRYFGNISFTYKLPVDGLQYQVQFGGNIRDKERRRFYGITTNPGLNTNGKLAVSTLNSTSYQINNLLQYNKQFSSKHRVNAVLGVTYDVKKSKNQIYQVSEFSTLKFRYEQARYAQAVINQLEDLYKNEQLLSYLSRVNYTLKNRYIFTASFRADGSSKFSDENKFSYFPAAAFAWRVSKENFMESIDFMNDLKFRVGWGKTGNQGISPYETKDNFGPVSYGTPSGGILVGFAPRNIANPDLKWETTDQLNIGLDFGLFNNRVTGTVDLYDKTTKDLLQNQKIGPSTGYTTMRVNRGDVSNKGVEFALNGTVVNKNDFRLDLGGNISFNKSEILELGNPPASILIDGEYQQRSYYLGDVVSSGGNFKNVANVFVQGEEIGMFYGWETDGMYQEGDTDILDGNQAGDVRRVDQNGDGIVDGDDRTLIGNPNPDFIYGLNLSMTYKRFNLSVLANGVQGNEIAFGDKYTLSNVRGGGNNVLREAYFDAWTPTNPSNTYPRLEYSLDYNAPTMTDRVIQDGSYFRLSNITLGYDVPVDGFLSSFNIYASGSNLLTITDYQGYNPDITSFSGNGNILGVDWNGVPNVKTVLLGLNIKF
tara:strand:+ start:620 stop:3748 length:3129 start_codon:yes stop_codon:yes gene_type:complete